MPGEDGGTYANYDFILRERYGTGVSTYGAPRTIEVFRNALDKFKFLYSPSVEARLDDVTGHYYRYYVANENVIDVDDMMLSAGDHEKFTYNFTWGVYSGEFWFELVSIEPSEDIEEFFIFGKYNDFKSWWIDCELSQNSYIGSELTIYDSETDYGDNKKNIQEFDFSNDLVFLTDFDKTENFYYVRTPSYTDGSFIIAADNLVTAKLNIKINAYSPVDEAWVIANKVTITIGSTVIEIPFDSIYENGEEIYNETIDVVVDDDAPVSCSVEWKINEDAFDIDTEMGEFEFVDTPVPNGEITHSVEGLYFGNKTLGFYRDENGVEYDRLPLPEYLDQFYEDFYRFMSFNSEFDNTYYVLEYRKKTVGKGSIGINITLEQEEA